MSRLSGVFWFILVVGSGMTNFLVKQTVQNLDNQLTHVRRETADEQKKIHDLTAEWTFLNQPELLADLNNRYVHLVPITPKQVVASIDSIPLRPAPPPPAQDAAPQIAEATPIPPPEATPVPPPLSSRAPIVPVSATTTVRDGAAAEPATGPARAVTSPSAHSSSLDALFAQVAGDH